MKSILVLLGLWFLGSGAEGRERNIITKYGHLDILLEDLQGQHWHHDEAPCLEQLVKIIRNVQNSTLWATWIWDSMQLPIGHLYGSKNNYGNYDECMDFPWKSVHPDLRTQYCLAHINLCEVDSQSDKVDVLGHVQEYIRAQTKYHLKFNSLTWGVCAPAICQAHSVTKFVGVLFKHSHLGLAVDKPLITVNNCDIAGETAARDFGYYFARCLTVFLIFFTLLCTLQVNLKGSSNKLTGLVLKAFNISTNTQSLIKIADDDIRSIFGIRVISSCIIIIIHMWMMPKIMGVSNGVRLNKDLEEMRLVSIFNLEIAVDTFLFMSGLFLIKSLTRNGLKPFNLFKVILKRYLRLIIAMVAFLLIMVKAVELPRGPVKTEFYDREMETCNKNWWTTLLMIQNYVDPENMCYPLLWSVPCDFHLSVLGTIIHWVHTKHRKTGILLFLVGLIASIALPATFMYVNKGPLIHGDFRLTDNYRKFLISDPLYTSTHFRAGSYFVGMAMGYFMSIYSHNQVASRKVFSKHQSILTFLFVLASIIGYFILGDVMLRRDYSVLVRAMYVSLKRIVWAALIGILIMVCEYGTLPLVTSFLSWSAWAPFSRLSYGIYLVHPGLLLIPVISTRTPVQHDIYGFLLATAGVIVFSSVASLVLWICVEAPTQNIVSLILSKNLKDLGDGTRWKFAANNLVFRNSNARITDLEQDKRSV